MGRSLAPPCFSLPFSALPTERGTQARLHKTGAYILANSFFFPFPVKTALSEDNKYLAEVNFFPRVRPIDG